MDNSPFELPKNFPAQLEELLVSQKATADDICAGGPIWEEAVDGLCILHDIQATAEDTPLQTAQLLLDTIGKRKVLPYACLEWVPKEQGCSWSFFWLAIVVAFGVGCYLLRPASVNPAVLLLPSNMDPTVERLITVKDNSLCNSPMHESQIVEIANLNGIWRPGRTCFDLLEELNMRGQQGRVTGTNLIIYAQDTSRGSTLNNLLGPVLGALGTAIFIAFLKYLKTKLGDFSA